MTPNPYEAWLDRIRRWDYLAADLARHVGLLLACIVLAEGVVPAMFDPQPWIVRGPFAAVVVLAWVARAVIGIVSERKYRRQVAIEKAQLRAERNEQEGTL